MDKYYQRNLIKDRLQDYVLQFVYNDKKYKKLIFTGGTALRKLYNLPRLSEDVDFDYPADFSFDIKDFEEKIKKFFRSLPEINLKETKIANNERTIFLKFSASEFFPKSAVDKKEVLFLRCDFSKVSNKNYKTEILPFNSEGLSFFVLVYDLPTLFANKLTAFLERKFFKGKLQKIPFKGRDLFDIYWFINLSAKSGFELKPNWRVLKENFPNLSKEEIVQGLIEKVKKINPKDLIADLAPFIQDKNYLTNFSKTYRQVITAKAPFIK